MLCKHFIVAITAAIVFAVASDPVEASKHSRRAISECKEAMDVRYDADGFQDVSVTHVGSQYKVVGYAEHDGRHSEWFECWTRNDRVVDLDFDGWDRSSSSSDKGKAIAAGIALAAVVAAAASAKKHHDDHDDDYDYDRYDRSYSSSSGVWHPARNVSCYRNTHMCYETGHGYSAYWTNREFH